MLLKAVLFVVGINVATFLAFAWDKICARNGWRRIAENTLLIMAAIGGTIGAVAGQHAMRHKTRKQPFRTYLYLVAGVQIIALAALTLQPVREAVWIAIQQVGG